MTLAHLSDAALLDGLRATCREANAIAVRLVAYLVEVERRGLHIRIPCSSMLDFCTRILDMSESAACRKIAAARRVSRFPRLLEHLESGDLTLTTLDLIGSHLTNQNVDELVAATTSMRKREIEELLVRRTPKPDLPEMICALPPPVEVLPGVPLVPPVETTAKPQTRIAPLSLDRHALQLTITGETRAKLERARSLMRHANPTGDLATLVDRALDALIAKLEKTRLGKTDRPRKSRGTKKGTISQATRRAVFERDGEQCTFKNPEGTRCPARDFLELDHVIPRARGGSDEEENLRVTCRTHNGFYAELVFGKDHMRRSKESGRLHQRRSASPNPPPTASIDPAILERSLRGLLGLGFRAHDARRALDIITARHTAAATPPPIEQIVREAIAALT